MWEWNVGGIILRQETEISSRETCPTAILAQNSDLVLDRTRGLHGDRSATTRLCHGKANS